MAAGRITLTRKAAGIKLESASRATYFFQRGHGEARYEREVPVAEMVRAFQADLRARLRIDRETSKHVVTLVERRDLLTGYEVEF